MAKKKPINWKNRIVRHGEQPANQFTANALNFRRHPNQQREALRGSLSELGWIQSVVVNKTTGNVIDGHARIEEALSIDEESLVPFVEVEISEDEEKLALATFDPISAMATTDKEVLDILLHEVSTGDAALQQLMSDLAAKEGLIPLDSPEDVWRGMPEYEQPDISGIVISVHFETREDVEDFARRINQTITDKTRSIWHPYKAPENLKSYSVQGDES